MSPDPKKPLVKATDEAEPKAERFATPVTLVVLLALMVFGGMVYLSNNAGGFNAQVYKPYGNFDQVTALQPQTGNGGIAKRKLIFNGSCAACHQANGLGTPGQFPPLAGSEWALAPEPNRIIRIVLNGFQGPVEVTGKPFNGVMVPWKDSLKDEDIANVLSYVRQEWGNKAPPVTAAQVQAIRTETASKGDAWTAPELLQIPDR